MTLIKMIKRCTWLVPALICAGLFVSAVAGGEGGRQNHNFWQVQPNEPGLLRLHVVANSNRLSDQLFKSNLVDEVQRLLADSGKHWAAAEADFIDENMPLLQEELRRFALLTGNPPPEIRVTLSREEFPLRAYGRNVYPPGEYASLTVHIGESMGDNWWCLLFPPLCLPMAEAKSSPEQEVAAEEINDPAGQPFCGTGGEATPNPEPIWRFKLFEQWSRWFGDN